MKILKHSQLAILTGIFALSLWSCSDDDDNGLQGLTVPDNYVSVDYATNAATEDMVIDELGSLTADVNDAEASAPNAGISSIDYPSTLASITESNYKTLVEGWLPELVNAANSSEAFVNPGLGNTPDGTSEGGLLGTRLLDEYGLELEQMVEKGSFGAALYNHAITVVNNIKSGEEGFNNSDAIDRLVEIHGTEPSFDITEVTAAAKYSKRRSDLAAQTGFFFDIKNNLITAKAAMDAGNNFNVERDNALDEYLLNWEKSNFATVIFYCKSTVDQLNGAFQLADGEQREIALGNAMHAYGEGVAFAHGFKRMPIKQITDAQIDFILSELKAEEGQNPESYQFLNDTSLLQNLEDLIGYIQNIYNFSDAEVESFYVNN
ncbi:hypothetical protein [Psychroflexus salis]|uniref:DUF4856 domain-containing protein n=1 Tax=Psychroflexus salis TaxID=1526574 RepID=A0A916ZVI2_9FLAO|nr:hypothetical protein [Psychroflexus salis]GGE15965.1 hypothetical protein GCM10010831_16590 [Psychroflexus salis]